jgi:hypothetical protein
MRTNQIASVDTDTTVDVDTNSQIVELCTLIVSKREESVHSHIVGRTIDLINDRFRRITRTDCASLQDSCLGLAWPREAWHNFYES